MSSRAPVLASAASFILLLVVFPAWRPRDVGLGLDDGWRLAVNMALDRGLGFGTDFVFTLGPLGFAYQPVPWPTTYLWALLFWLVVGLAYGLLAVFVAAPRGASAPARAALTALVTLVAVAARPRSVDALLLALGPAIVWAQLDDRPTARRAGVFLAAVAGAAALVKFTLLVALAGCIAGAALGAARLRRIPWPMLAFILVHGLVWVLCGQPLDRYPSYLAASAEVAQGFSAAMMHVDAGLGLGVGLYLSAIACVVLGAGSALSRSRRLEAPGVVVLLSIALVAFVGFKAAFVRHDAWHEVTAVHLAALLVALGGSRFAPGAPRVARASFATAATVVLVMLHLCATTPGEEHRRGLPSFARAALREVPRQLGRMVEVGRSGLDAVLQRKAALAEAAGVHEQLPQDPGRVDVLPWEIGLLALAGADWHGRPVPQSYSAYTEDLARRNRDFLRGSTAPDTILFSVRSIDERAPFLDDALSWPELLSRYELDGSLEGRLVLRRASEPGSYVLLPLVELEGSLGRPLELPPVEPGAWLWAEIRVAPSWAGRLAGVLFRPGRLVGRWSLPTGRYEGTVVPSLMAAGFLLHPLVTDTASFAALYEPARPLESGPRTLTLAPDPDVGLSAVSFDERYQVRLYTLRVEAAGRRPMAR